MKRVTTALLIAVLVVQALGVAIVAGVASAIGPLIGLIGLIWRLVRGARRAPSADATMPG